MANTQNENSDPYKAIFNKYNQMRKDLKESRGKINTESFFNKHKLVLSDEDKRFVTNKLLLTNLSETQSATYTNGVVEWKDQNYNATIDLRLLKDSILIINGTQIQLEINFANNSFKDLYSTNQSLIKRALLKKSLSSMSWGEIIFKAMLLPLSSVTACGANTSSSNEGILAGLALAPLKAAEGATGMGMHLAECIGASCLYTGSRVGHEVKRQVGIDKRPYGESIGKGLKNIWGL